MNDRSVSLLEQYEITVNRTWKGRGAILCDTDRGLKIFMEYPCPKEKIILQDTLLTHIKEAGVIRTESIVRNKEGELLCIDTDQTAYVLKDYFNGQECVVRDMQDCKRAVRALAKLHKLMYLPAYCAQNEVRAFSLTREFEKRTRELKKVYKFLQHKGQRGDFELYLLHHFLPFYEKAKQISLRVQEEYTAEEQEHSKKMGSLCHGDFQYHNVMFCGGEAAVIHFERCIVDSQMRDLCLFLRKMLEKNNWDVQEAAELLEIYDKEKTLTAEDRRQLYYRFAYPEKFWKIVNFYYNNGKAWIPEKNMEKLTQLLSQEENREKFLESIR
ncbi:MAG: CotS family spore coat protein [Clostridiales bacterium]|nr:CotS family spore coat protein [Clostridiales bacterium]